MEKTALMRRIKVLIGDYETQNANDQTLLNEIRPGDSTVAIVFGAILTCSPSLIGGIVLLLCGIASRNSKQEQRNAIASRIRLRNEKIGILKGMLAELEYSDDVPKELPII